MAAHQRPLRTTPQLRHRRGFQRIASGDTSFTMRLVSGVVTGRVRIAPMSTACKPRRCRSFEQGKSRTRDHNTLLHFVSAHVHRVLHVVAQAPGTSIPAGSHPLDRYFRGFSHRNFEAGDSALYRGFLVIEERRAESHSFDGQGAHPQRQEISCGGRWCGSEAGEGRCHRGVGLRCSPAPGRPEPATVDDVATDVRGGETVCRVHAGVCREGFDPAAQRFHNHPAGRVRGGVGGRGPPISSFVG